VAAIKGAEEVGEGTSEGEADRDLIRALVQSAAGRHRQALAILARILERFPEAHGIAWAAAEEAVHVQSLDAALAYAGRARSLAAGFGPRREARYASHLRRAGLLEEAVVLARGAFSESPDDHIICLHLANILAARGETDEAVSLFEDLVKRQPQFSEALRGHGALLSDLKLWDRAAEMYLRALKIREGDADTWLNLGNARLAQGQPVPAEEALRQALKLRPDFPFARNSLATALRGQGKLADARKEAEALLRLSPGYAEGHSTLGSILHRMGNLKEAERAYRRALEYKPDLLQANFNLALVLGESHPDQAIDLYRRVLKVSPDDVEALTNLSGLLADKLLFDEALSLAEKACALAPGDATSWNNLATTRLEAGQKAGAVLALRRAVAADPSRIEPRYNLFFVLREDDPLEALAHALEFVRLDPTRSRRIQGDLEAIESKARGSEPRHPLILALAEGRAQEPASAVALDTLVVAWVALPGGDVGSRLHALKSSCLHVLIQLARRRGHTTALEKLEKLLKTR